eukprot:COSAG01_NODE_38_length_33931_cov_75.163632_7_plen_51_part_00
MAAKKGTNVQNHKHVCSHHFKEAVKDKVNGGKGSIKLNKISESQPGNLAT